MLPDISALPLPAGVLIAGAAYAAVSFLVTGPLVGERTIEKSDWPARCARHSLEASAESLPASRSLACGAILGTLYGRDGAALCARYGDVVALSRDVLGSMRQGHRDTAGEQAASGSRCTCAVRTVLDTRRLDLALYAGTARLVTRLSVRTLDAELARAARSPVCAPPGVTR